MAKKKNLEGNTSSKFTISELSHKSMHDMSQKMGVMVDNDSSNSFDLLKEIENARLNLYNKQQKAKANIQIIEIDEEAESSDQLQLEWLQEENSEPDDFTIVQSRKQKKENKRNLEISPISKRGKKAQEDPGLLRKRGRKKKH